MRNYAQVLQTYCDDILSGKITAGIYTVKAVQRFRRDLQKSQRADFPYEYIQEETLTERRFPFFPGRFSALRTWRAGDTRAIPTEKDSEWHISK